MPTIPVGEGGGGGSPLPVKWLLLGGGGLLVAFLVMRGKSSGGGGGDVATGESIYGSALGPNAALALGGLQTQVMQESGYLQQLFTDQAAALGDQSQQQYTSLLDAIFGVGDQAADFNFWRTAQDRGAELNIRAAIEGWDVSRWAAESKVYAEQMISQRPDLASYFRDNWERQYTQFDWDNVAGASALPAGGGGSGG